jgi:prepilin-type N-terminal cleavage/methylation domain-containing protein
MIDSTHRAEGFSLIEVLIATVLVGLAITALVAANSSFTLANDAGTDLSTAEFLIEQIRELTTMLPVVDPETETATFGPEEPNVAAYDDLDDFDGASFSPPIDGTRTPLISYPEFRQRITVQNLNPSYFDEVVADHGSAFVRVTVTVFQNNIQVNSASWIRARY